METPTKVDEELGLLGGGKDVARCPKHQPPAPLLTSTPLLKEVKGGRRGIRRTRPAQL
jgi:hypothetical protein